MASGMIQGHANTANNAATKPQIAPVPGVPIRAPMAVPPIVHRTNQHQATTATRSIVMADLLPPGKRARRRAVPAFRAGFGLWEPFARKGPKSATFRQSIFVAGEACQNRQKSISCSPDFV